MSDLFERLAHERLLPLAVPRSDAHAAELLVDITASGRSVLEIALRSDQALSAIRAVAGSSDVLVGAGTVVTPAQVDAVVEAGARFVVTPGFDHAVVARCLHHRITVLPGVATPGEIMVAIGLGLDTVKLFPAAALGGPAMVDALRGPFPNIRLVPSGGITGEAAPDYLSRANVLAISRSWPLPEAGRAT